MSSESSSRPLEMLESRQAAIKNRVITHLNADHAFSLEIYLRHFCGVPQKQAASAKLTDMTTEYMIIESRAGRNVIQFDPPMKSLMEAREKTVALHHEALAGLGLSSTQINTFALPNKLWQQLTCLAVILCFTTFPFRPQLLPSTGSVIFKVWSVGGLVPGLASLAYQTSPFVLPAMLVIHGVEMVVFARKRLRKHQVQVGSGLWCLWSIHAFIGGVACFDRFDNMVREKEEQQQKKEKH